MIDLKNNVPFKITTPSKGNTLNADESIMSSLLIQPTAISSSDKPLSIPSTIEIPICETSVSLNNGLDIASSLASI